MTLHALGCFEGAGGLRFCAGGRSAGRARRQNREYSACLAGALRKFKAALRLPPRVVVGWHEQKHCESSKRPFDCRSRLHSAKNRKKSVSKAKAGLNRMRPVRGSDARCVYWPDLHSAVATCVKSGKERMQNMKSSKVALLFAIIPPFSGLTLANERADPAEVLKEITDTADRLCGDVAQSGDKSIGEVKGEVKAELSGLARKLANLGVSGTGTIVEKSIRGCRPRTACRGT